MMALIAAIVAELPAMIALGVNVVSIIPELKKSVDAATGNGEITQADSDAMHARIAAAEDAWALQVKQAQAELDAAKGNG